MTRSHILAIGVVVCLGAPVIAGPCMNYDGQTSSRRAAQFQFVVSSTTPSASSDNSQANTQPTDMMPRFSFRQRMLARFSGLLGDRGNDNIRVARPRTGAGRPVAATPGNAGANGTGGVTTDASMAVNNSQGPTAGAGSGQGPTGGTASGAGAGSGLGGGAPQASAVPEPSSYVFWLISAVAMVSATRKIRK